MFRFSKIFQTLVFLKINLSFHSQPYEWSVEVGYHGRDCELTDQNTQNVVAHLHHLLKNKFLKKAKNKKFC